MSNKKVKPVSVWHVYMVSCVDGSLYTGITTDLERRLAEHNGIRRGGARYTRNRRPVTLVWFEGREDRAAASRREYEIKKFSRRKKLALMNANGASISSVETAVVEESIS